MRAVRNTADGIQVVAVPDVEPGDELVRVHVRAAGICGSDLHLVAWGPMPVTLGHEFAGVLDDGTAVAVQPYTPCLTCDRCLAGEQQLCRTGWSRVHGISLDGGLADAVAVDPRALVELPAGLDVADAGLVEPVAVAVHGLNLTGVEPGQRIAVIGGGSIGLCAVAAARARGADADLVARHAHQVTAGERLGAGRTVADDYDVVVDAAGTQAAVDQAFALVRPGGTVVAMATYWTPVQVGLAMTTKEVRFVASSAYGLHGGANEFAAAAGTLAAVPELPDVLITHRFGLDDAPEAFRVAGARADGAIKVLLAP